MAVSKAHIRATAKYEQKAYDKVLLRLKKGRREELQNHAIAFGESLNGFVSRAIDETVERDKERSE